MRPFAPSPLHYRNDIIAGSQVRNIIDNVSLSESIFSILHDLKNPLWGIRMSSLVLGSDSTSPGMVREVAEDIKVSCDQIFSLLFNLHELYCAELNNVPIDMDTTDIRSLVLSCVQQHLALAEYKSIKLNSNLFESDGEVTAHSYAPHLSRILSNLISNAIKFTPVKKEVKILLYENDTEVLCTISDEGPGFTDDDLVILYDKFTPRSALPTNGELSSRLGLAIVKALSDNISIGIELKTELGIGSQFTIIIPKMKGVIE